MDSERQTTRKVQNMTISKSTTISPPAAGSDEASRVRKFFAPNDHGMAAQLEATMYASGDTYATGRVLRVLDSGEMDALVIDGSLDNDCQHSTVQAVPARGLHGSLFMSKNTSVPGDVFVTVSGFYNPTLGDYDPSLVETVAAGRRERYEEYCRQVEDEGNEPLSYGEWQRDEAESDDE